MAQTLVRQAYERARGPVECDLASCARLLTDIERPLKEALDWLQLSATSWPELKLIVRQAHERACGAIGRDLASCARALYDTERLLGEALQMLLYAAPPSWQRMRPYPPCETDGRGGCIHGPHVWCQGYLL